MEDIKNILLKLHYLDLEINEIYQILQRLYQFKKIENNILRKVLNEKYEKFLKLSTEQIKNDLFFQQIEFITIVDKNYPKSLENIFMPPLILFYQGNINLFNKKALAVVGSRYNSPYGEKVAKKFVCDLVRHDFNIISGLAYGIDSIAHKACIDNNGKTIAVLGSGLLHIYPKEHSELANVIAKEHLLISEYPPHVLPQKTHFPFRNRIVSGLANGVLVIEAKERSGTLITCDYALDQGKDIFVVPNNIFDQNSIGTNNLIKQGAKLVTNINDILESFKLKTLANF